MKFCQSLAQKRPNIFLFEAGIEERGQGVEGEEEDSPDHAEPAGQEGSGEGRLAVRLLVKAEMLRVWSLALMAFILYVVMFIHPNYLLARCLWSCNSNKVSKPGIYLHKERQNL